VVPFTSELLLIDMDSNLMTALLFLMVTVILSITGLERTRYGIIWSLASRKTISVINLSIPFLISVASLILVSRTFSLKTIVDLQRDHWNVVYQPFGLIIAVISVVLILKVLGLNSEGRRGLSSVDRSGGNGFSGTVSRFSRYSIILFMTYLITLLYLGGYKSLYIIRGDVMLGLKFYILFIFILFAGKALGSNMSDAGVFMRISGKFLIPLSIVNFAVTLGFFILRNIYGLV
jgi:NADH:ubiquinone oxidoreductase subunit H